MLCTVLSARDIEVNKTHKNIYQKAGGETENKQVKLKYNDKFW